MRRAWIWALLLGILLDTGIGFALAKWMVPGKKEVKREANGTFISVTGQAGEIGFGESFLEPPQVELRELNRGGQDVQYTVVAEVTTTGFKWKHGGPKEGGFSEKIAWKAKGKAYSP